MNLLTKMLHFSRFYRREKKPMAELACAHCGKIRELQRIVRVSHVGEKDDLIRGVLTCRGCDKQTVFGMRNNAIDFYPGKDMFGEPHKNAPVEVKDAYTEAVLSFYGAAYRSAVSMARACLEQSLLGRRIKEDKLEKMIEEAFSAKLITQEHQMLAHGSRLVGNNALHKAKVIVPVEAQVALSAVVQIVNYLFP